MEHVSRCSLFLQVMGHLESSSWPLELRDTASVSNVNVVRILPRPDIISPDFDFWGLSEC